MKLSRDPGQVVAPVILVLNLSACGMMTPANQTQSYSGQEKNLQQTINQAVDGVVKLKKELSIQADPSHAAAAPAVKAEPGKLPTFIDPNAVKSFKNLATLYADREAPANHSPTTQEDPKAFQNFLTDQSESTMAFAYQMRGDYQKAADIIKNRIASLETSNQDGSKAHRLAVYYAQYADYLNHLNRGGEAQQMQAKAHAIEPNHY